jgi:hypothetical protein
MTDSATDDAAGEGAPAVPAEFDELFASVAEEVADDGRSTERTVASRTSDEDRTDEPTAAVFDRLKVTERADADAVLEDDRPSAIIESADEPEPPADEPEIGVETLVDEETLEELLLPDRTEGEAFRWVETDETPAELTASEPIDETGSKDTKPEPRAAALDTPTDDGSEQNNTDATGAGSDGSSESATVSSGSIPLDLATVEAESTAPVAPTDSERAPEDGADGGRLSGIVRRVRSKFGRS